MRIYYCEDRSPYAVRCDSVQLYELNNWKAEDMDAMMNMQVGGELTTMDGIYVRREPDSDIKPDSIELQTIGSHQQALPL